MVGPARFVLPVSGVAVTLRPLTGAEELLLTDHAVDDPKLVLALLERVAVAVEPVEWAGLSVCDADTLLLRLRQAVVGARIDASLRCEAAGCGSRVALSFGVEDYLAHHRPRPRRGVAASAAAPGWFRLAAGGDGWRFRLPTLADQIAAAGLDDPAAGLAARCFAPVGVPARARARAEAVMAAMAPALAGPLQGVCPECGAKIAARFEARPYCLQELRDRAKFLFDDIDALAERYHWSEREILRLPRARRAGYAERALAARTG